MFYSFQHTDLSHLFTRFTINYFIAFLFLLSLSFCFQPLGALFLVPSIEICSLSKMLFNNLSLLIAIIVHLFTLLPNIFVQTNWAQLPMFPGTHGILSNRRTNNKLMKNGSHQHWEASKFPQPN